MTRPNKTIEGVFDDFETGILELRATPGLEGIPFAKQRAEKFKQAAQTLKQLILDSLPPRMKQVEADDMVKEREWIDGYNFSNQESIDRIERLFK